MKKILSTIAVFFFATTLSAMAANQTSGANETLKEEQIQEQQDLKRKETLDDMQVQAQKRKQQLQQQSVEINKHQERLGLESDKSSGKNKP